MKISFIWGIILVYIVSIGSVSASRNLAPENMLSGVGITNEFEFLRQVDGVRIIENEISESPDNEISAIDKRVYLDTDSEGVAHHTKVHIIKTKSTAKAWEEALDRVVRLESLVREDRGNYYFYNKTKNASWWVNGKDLYYVKGEDMEVLRGAYMSAFPPEMDYFPIDGVVIMKRGDKVERLDCSYNAYCRLDRSVNEKDKLGGIIAEIGSMLQIWDFFDQIYFKMKDGRLYYSGSLDGFKSWDKGNLFNELLGALGLGFDFLIKVDDKGVAWIKAGQSPWVWMPGISVSNVIEAKRKLTLIKNRDDYWLALDGRHKKIMTSYNEGLSWNDMGSIPSFLFGSRELNVRLNGNGNVQYNVDGQGFEDLLKMSSLRLIVNEARSYLQRAPLSVEFDFGKDRIEFKQRGRVVKEWPLAATIDVDYKVMSWLKFGVWGYAMGLSNFEDQVTTSTAKVTLNMFAPGYKMKMKIEAGPEAELMEIFEGEINTTLFDLSTAYELFLIKQRQRGTIDIMVNWDKGKIHNLKTDKEIEIRSLSEVFGFEGLINIDTSEGLIALGMLKGDVCAMECPFFPDMTTSQCRAGRIADNGVDVCGCKLAQICIDAQVDEEALVPSPLGGGFIDSARVTFAVGKNERLYFAIDQQIEVIKGGTLYTDGEILMTQKDAKLYYYITDTRGQVIQHERFERYRIDPEYVKYLERLILSPQEVKELPFTDVSEDAWERGYVRKLLDLEVITDKQAEFRGDLNLSRAEALKMLIRGFSLPPLAIEEGAQYFLDVPVKSWANYYFVLGQEYRITKGDGTGNMRPFDPVTRAELLKMISETASRQSFTDTLCIEEPERCEAEPVFKDVVVEDWFNAYTSWAVDKELINGESQEFFPNREITRREAAKMIALAISNLKR